ncbi:hypothetical protein EK21DRAFT_86213 [Setomelanomma holmii]|uniref:Rhodopsin domain-containing protein n=1 Tax=Setomelanomma holmii TaxID=210430 RepID=A0A9P4LS40_9PLEO|nr:hypothetical protein EK21DRAFT_86213 [Setomelanomma holmii]
MFDFRPTFIGVNATLIALSTIAVCCRLGRSVFLARSFGWNDGFIAVAAVCACITSGLLILSAHYGVGLPQDEVASENMTPILKLVMASCAFYFACNWAVKHSLLLFYYGLTIGGWPRFSIYFMHGVAITFGVTCIMTSIFQCWPLPAMWDPTVRGHCINIMAFHLFNSSFMIATDVVLYAMPLVFTWNMQLQRAQKICLNSLFALGWLVLAASGARVHAVYSQIVRPNFTYKFAIIMTWGVIENHVSIVVACAPSIKVLLVHAFPSLSTSISKLVSGEAKSNGIFRSSTMSLDVEAHLNKAQENATARPVGSRLNSDESAQSRRSRIGKWWRAPSSWEVNPLEPAGR